MENTEHALREMHISRTFNAPVDLLWEVWTKPEHIINWWGPKGFTSTVHHMEVKEGGEWTLTMHGPDGTNYPNRSIFREIIPFKKIVFEHFNPHFFTTVVFEAQGEKTLMHWTMLFDTTEMRDTVIKAHKADEGQKQNIEKLENYLNHQKHIIMKNDLFFDFTVDKTTGTIVVKREFAAALPLVWDAWTRAEILDKWWAPKPYHAETKSMNFNVGGTWLYAMVSPENEKHWCRAAYTSIDRQKQFSYRDAFCDENGTPSKGKPSTAWTNVFSESNGKTTVLITLLHDSPADMETLIQMGFKEGFTMGLQNLDEWLAQQQ